MAYVIGHACLDVRDGSCAPEGPVDCIYEADREMYVYPDECIDRGACEAVCPVEAFSRAEDVPEVDAQHVEDNAEFFLRILPGGQAPLGEPGGARSLGRVGVDTPMVAAFPPA